MLQNVFYSLNITEKLRKRPATRAFHASGSSGVSSSSSVSFPGVLMRPSGGDRYRFRFSAPSGLLPALLPDSR